MNTLTQLVLVPQADLCPKDVVSYENMKQLIKLTLPLKLKRKLASYGIHS